MLGLLGGLLGRGIAGGMASRAFAARPRGPLAGLLANRSRRMASSRGGVGEQQDRREPEQRPEPEQPQQAAPESQPEPVASSQPQQSQQSQQPQPFVQQASQPIQETAQQQQAAAAQPPSPGQPAEVEPPKTATAGLLDDPPPLQEARPRSAEEPVPEPQAVVNQTESPSPVARPEQEQFGETPMLATSGILDKIGDTPQRRDFPMEDPNPSQPVQLNQARHTANSPGFHYQTAGSYTAFTPSYSYRRR